MITDNDINKLAELSRLALKDTEKASFSKEIDAILGYVSHINSLTSGDIESDFATVNTLRDDEVIHKRGEYTKELIANAPEKEGNFVKVKKILN